MIERSGSRDRWQTCTILEARALTPTIKGFLLRPSAPFSHKAGQHVDVRLTAPNGYRAVRSYSIASAPGPGTEIELAVERLADGEVSSFLHDEARAGDELDISGPLGGHFIWPEDPGGPVLLIGAGSGLVPLMSMIRHRRTAAQGPPVALLLSARTREDVLFRTELLETEASLKQFVLAFAMTREPARRPADFGRRVDGGMVADVVARLPMPPRHAFVCGSNAFVDAAVDGALAAGIAAEAIRTERFGA